MKKANQKSKSPAKIQKPDKKAAPKKEAADTKSEKKTKGDSKKVVSAIAPKTSKQEEVRKCKSSKKNMSPSKVQESAKDANKLFKGDAPNFDELQEQEVSIGF